VGLSIAALAAASSIAGADVFEIEQPSLSVKLTKTQLAALLLPAPALFSGLPAVSMINDADLFVVEQAGVIKKMTKAVLLSLIGFPFLTVDQTILKQNGDVIYYNGANYVTGPTPQWRVIHTNAYTEAAVASTSTITFAGGGPTSSIYLKATDYFSVGTPVRAVIRGNGTIYGICSAVTDTLLTIAGASMQVAEPILSLSVGTKDMVKHFTLMHPATTYNLFSSTDITKQVRLYWKGASGHLCAFSASHMNTSATTVVIPYISSIAVGSTGITLAAGTATTHGAFVDNTAGTLIYDQCNITNGEMLTVRPTTVGGAADFLVMCLTFVVP